MNGLEDIHEHRFETLGRRALERLRVRLRSAHGCPNCGYQGTGRDCPRYGELSESESRRPRSRRP